MITWYNYPYYATHFEQLGYKMEKNMSKVNFFSNVKPGFSRANELVKKIPTNHSILRQPKRSCLMLIRCLMYLINLTLLYPLVAITDIQKNISEKIHRINQPEYIKFVEKTTILLLQYCYAFLFQSFTKKQKESYSLWIYTFT
jgi:hypothetical protein